MDGRRRLEQAARVDWGQQERWYSIKDRPLRAVVAGVGRPDVPAVVIVPGWGAVGYLCEAVEATGAWTRCVLLDVPGFGHGRENTCEPTLQAVAATVVTWLVDYRPGRVVLAGHSTGAQAVLRVAAELPDVIDALVLAGPTFAPSTRRLVGLGRAWARTSRHEPSSGLWATLPDYRRGGVRRLTRYLRSGLADRPEELVGRVRCPMLLARGEHDHFSTAEWVERLAAAAPRGQAVTVSGAHAFPYSHPSQFVHLLAEAASWREHHGGPPTGGV